MGKKRPQPQKLPIASVRRNISLQMRESMDLIAIAEYSQMLDELPPVDVFFDGKVYWLAHGFHRFDAHELFGRTEIACVVHEGSYRDAMLFALSCNATNGIRRKNEDKEKAVKAVLEDPEWKQYSDRKIAEMCCVSQPFVGKIRRQLITVISCDEPETRIGADGKRRKVPNPKQQNKPKETFECVDCGKEWDINLADCPECAEKDVQSVPNLSGYTPSYDEDTGLVTSLSFPTNQPEPETNYFDQFKALWDAANEIARAAIRAFVIDETESKPKPKKKASQSITVEDVDIPEELACDEVREALRMWLNYKRERREGYKKATYVSSMLRRFTTSQAFIDAVHYSVGNGYKGLFSPPGGSLDQSDPRGNKAAIAEYLRKWGGEDE